MFPKWFTHIPGLRRMLSRRDRRRMKTAQARLRVETLEARDVPSAAGSLDQTFGNGGLVTTDLLLASSQYPDSHPVDFPSCVALQADGKILVGGLSLPTNGVEGTSAAIVRYNVDGSLDTSFGLDGKVIIDFRGYGWAKGIAVQADGKIVIASDSLDVQDPSAHYDFAAARLNSDGSLDTSFGTGGKTIVDFGGDDFANSVAVQADGKIVLAGNTSNGGDFAVARLNADGSLDTSFDGDGTTTLHTDGYIDAAFMTTHDGQIVMAGTSYTDFGSDISVARLNADGTPDTGFGLGGVRTIDFDNHTTSYQYDHPYGVVVQADGKTVVVGYQFYSDSVGFFGWDMTLSRLNQDGTLDTSFDGDGMETIDLGSDDYGYGVSIQPDGKLIVIATTVQESTGSNIAVLRLNPDGSFDTGFGTGGQFILDFGNYSDADAVAVQADGNIIVVGAADSGGATGVDFGLARLIGNENVTSLPNAETGNFVTLQSTVGTTLTAVTAVAAPPPSQRAGTGLPKTADLPIGAFDFSVGGVSSGTTTEVVIIMPTGTIVNAYYKYNPTTNKWSKFNGAQFVDRNGDGTPDVVLSLTDGGAGDQDGLVNGVIVDPGAPAFVVPIEVQIDVRSSVNLASQGLIAAVVFSSTDFDARLVDASSVRFAGASAVQSSVSDVNGDGLLDLVLNFRTQDTTLRALYEQLLADDINEDGVLDSSHQEASVALTGNTNDNDQFEGSDTVDLFLSGKNLRDMLANLAASGMI